MSDGFRLRAPKAADNGLRRACMARGPDRIYCLCIDPETGLPFTAMSAVLDPGIAQAFELRFVSLFNPGRALSFRCDAGGRVDLDALCDRARHNYLYARAVVGREYATPEIVRADGSR